MGGAHGPAQQNLDDDLRFSSREHPLGTDKLGRDILSRIIYGSRVSLLVGVTTVTLSLALGFTLGSLAGYLGGWTDHAVMRTVDILLAFPGILLAIAFTAVLGPGLDHVILALCLIGWTGYARFVRGEILCCANGFHLPRPLAVRRRTSSCHLLPNLLTPLLIQATWSRGSHVAEGSLSFLGLGEPPTASGAPCSATINSCYRAAATTYPGQGIVITVLVLEFIGDELQSGSEAARDLPTVQTVGLFKPISEVSGFCRRTERSD